MASLVEFGVIESHTMGDAAAAVVSYNGEFRESQMLHHFDLVLRHGALGVAKVVRAARRFAAIAVTAKVRNY